MNVLIIIGIIIGIVFLKEMILWIDQATYSSRLEKKWEKNRKERRREEIELDRQRENERKKIEKELKNKIDKIKKDSDCYYNKYKNSANTMEIISALKASIPNPPYNWNCVLQRNGICCGISRVYSFSQHGYKELSSDEQVYGLARAIAYNLGYGFEATIDYSCYDGGSIGILVKYIFTRSLKEF